jgi:diguanylate cyclase (GGDEF)-like protein
MRYFNHCPSIIASGSAPLTSTPPYFQRALRYLLASSKFQEEDLRFLSLPLIHEIVYRIFSLVTPFAIFPALLISWQKQQSLVMAAQIVVGSVVMLHAWLLLKNNYRVLSPLMMFSVSVALYILAISRGEHFVMYWSSAFTVAFYLLVKKRAARLMNVAWIVLNSILALAIFRMEQSVYFIFSLATTGFFVEILFAILNRHEKHLEWLATRDPLTNAFNRRRMMEDLERAVALCSRHNSPASIIIIDADKFKSINDTFGHQEGDAVLKNLAQILSSRIRCSDRFYRYGGEEFVAFLAETHLIQAARVADIFCELVRNAEVSKKGRITISCGVAEVRRDESVSEWISRADSALYKAKHNGRDRFEIEEFGGGHLFSFGKSV